MRALPRTMLGVLALAGCDGVFGISEHSLAPADAGDGGTGTSDSAEGDAHARDASVRDGGVEGGTSYPETCAELHLSVGTQEETLYLNHSPQMPWTAVCVTTVSSSNTYLPLPSTGNQSVYPLGGCGMSVGGSAGVVTTYSRVLFDPTTLLVDTSDTTGAVSTGETYEVSGNGSFMHAYSSMAYASARSCEPTPGPSASGSINLAGTHFVVDPGQAFTVLGTQGSGQGTTTGAGTAATLRVNGYPAGISACSNDYYTDTGGPCLKLAYVSQ